MSWPKDHIPAKAMTPFSAASGACRRVTCCAKVGGSGGAGTNTHTQSMIRQNQRRWIKKKKTVVLPANEFSSSVAVRFGACQRLGEVLFSIFTSTGAVCSLFYGDFHRGRSDVFALVKPLVA